MTNSIYGCIQLLLFFAAWCQMVEFYNPYLWGFFIALKIGAVIGWLSLARIYTQCNLRSCWVAGLKFTGIPILCHLGVYWHMWLVAEEELLLQIFHPVAIMAYFYLLGIILGCSAFGTQKIVTAAISRLRHCRLSIFLPPSSPN